MKQADFPEHLDGPPFKGDMKAALAESVRGWSESSRMMEALCRARGTTFVQVIQPALLDEGGRTPTEAELADARSGEEWTIAVREGYPLLRAAGAVLLAEGVAVVDATQVFAGVEARVFQDAVHLNRLGNELLAEAIAAGVLAALPE